MRLAAALPNMAGGSLAGIVETAATAEALGWESVWVADHVLVDKAASGQYGHAIEALETLAFVAGRFHRVRIGTAVLIAPMRDPVVLARQLSTIDLLSEGRLTVGVGVGWGAGEYRNLGAEDRFHNRGAHLDEAIRLWRHLWAGNDTPFEGRYRRLDDFAFAPMPPQGDRIPIWVGGASPAALRRAAAADGYVASQAEPAQLAERVSALDELTGAAGHDRPTIAARLPVSEGELWDPDALRERIAAYGAAGADLLIIGLPGASPDQVADRLRQIDQLR
jgi:probable F420-dependent oxidoreductase